MCPSVSPSPLGAFRATPEIELIFCKPDLWITWCDSDKCLAENGFQSQSKWKLLQGKCAFLCLGSSSSPSWLCVWVYMGWIWIHFLGNWIDTVMHGGSATLLCRADGLSDWIGLWGCVCVRLCVCVCMSKGLSASSHKIDTPQCSPDYCRTANCLTNNLPPQPLTHTHACTHMHADGYGSGSKEAISNSRVDEHAADLLHINFVPAEICSHSVRPDWWESREDRTAAHSLSSPLIRNTAAVTVLLRQREGGRERERGQREGEIEGTVRGEGR